MLNMNSATGSTDVEAYMYRDDIDCPGSISGSGSLPTVWRTAILIFTPMAPATYKNVFAPTAPSPTFPEIIWELK